MIGHEHFQENHHHHPKLTERWLYKCMHPPLWIFLKTISNSNSFKIAHSYADLKFISYWWINHRLVEEKSTLTRGNQNYPRLINSMAFFLFIPLPYCVHKTEPYWIRSFTHIYQCQLWPSCLSCLSWKICINSLEKLRRLHKNCYGVNWLSNINAMNYPVLI